MNRLIRDLSGYTEWDYALSQGTDIGGFWSFWSVFRAWWEMRPRRVPCAYCSAKVWTIGNPDGDIFCCEGCAYYGSADAVCPDCGEDIRTGDHSNCVPF